jgi:hypothetical protein
VERCKGLAANVVDSVEGKGVIDVVGCCGEGLEQPATTTRKLASKTILVISR